MNLLSPFRACLLVVASGVSSAAMAAGWSVTARWTADQEAALWWERPAGAQRFRVCVDGTVVGETLLGNHVVRATNSETAHSVVVTAIDASGKVVATSDVLPLRFPRPAGTVNVRDYGADGSGRSLTTAALQRAIAACPDGGTVLFPRGTYLSGALFLKSNVTLLLEEGAVLQGSEDPQDYPIVRSRFEGWETDAYASLINGGTLSHERVFNLSRVAIHGRGRITGGGELLAEEQIARRGRRSRGRLISITNARDVDIAGVVCEGSPSWTLHFTYSERINCRDLSIASTVRNGDGIDPDSCTDVWIYNCRFQTGDDCIAVKSGKNPEGVVIARPTENVWITDCVFQAGHGISIGSEISGGVRNVHITDCAAGPLKFGLQIKATPERGGYVENVHVSRCRIGKIRVLTSLPYNNDGAPAPSAPFFRGFTFEELDMRDGDTAEPAIEIHGFADEANWTRDLLFRDVRMPDGAGIVLERCERIRFEQVRTASGGKPAYTLRECRTVVH